MQKEGEWVLMMAPGSEVPALDGAMLIRTLSLRAGAFLIRIPAGEEVAIRQKLSGLPGFLNLQPNYYLTPRSLEPDDPYFVSQWNMELIQAPDAWAFATGGATALGDQIAVAVIDDGFDLEHPDLIGNLWTNTAEDEGLPLVDDDGNGYTDDVQGWNFDTESPVLPIKSHGTAVFGILGAMGNNGAGVAGVNWKIKVIPLVVRTIGDIIEAYDSAGSLRKKYNDSGGAEGTFVVAASASLGFDEVFCSEFPSLQNVLNQIGEAGVLSVAATANDNWNVDEVGDIPTSCTSEFLISVTNTDRFDQKYEEAAYGEASIDLSAPGGPPDEGVFTTRPPGGYEESFGGTSAACPHVSGAVALLYAMPSAEFAQLVRDEPGEAALLVKNAILGGVDSLGALQGITVTGGRLNLYRSALYLHGAFQPIAIPDPGQYADRRRLLRVFPNPVFSGHNLEIVYGSKDLEPVTLRLYNALGQLLAQVSVSPAAFADQTISLPTANLATGAYWVVLENGVSPIAEKVIVY